jgi:hypothetical protein
MEPIEVIGLAGVAAAAWALGRASQRWSEGEGNAGDRVAQVGADVSRRAAYGTAHVAGRAIDYSAAGVAAAGALAARGAGAAADAAVAASSSARDLVPGLRRGHNGTDKTNGDKTTEKADTTESAPKKSTATKTSRSTSKTTGTARSSAAS